MSFDKSLKLLNYAKNNNGYLQLFSELDHNYKAGDKLFIVGGYLDNTSQLINIPDFTSGTLYNPFSQYKTGYKILSVDIVNNAFTIDYPVTDSTVVYPYGTAANRFGNPSNFSNLAYNTFAGNKMYKNIYVSRTSFIAGRIKKAVINNGIFGNDTNKIILNNPESTAGSATLTNIIIINHIASKNITISKGIINSKTDINNPITKKLEILEDLTVDIDNPFLVNTLSVSNNNNGYGYSSFERFKHTSNVTINNGDFNNPYNSNIVITSLATINKAKIGAKEPMYFNGCSINNITMNAGELNNVYHDGGLISANNIKFNTLITLNATSLEWSGTTPGDVKFYVNYNALANRIWPALPINVIISGISLNSSNYHVLNQGLTGTLESLSYTFGDINSATMTFHFPELVADWASISSITATDFNPTNLKLSFINGVNSLIIDNSSITGYLGNTLGNIFLRDNNTVGEGHYTNVVHNNSTTFAGASFDQNAYITESYQLNTQNGFVPIMRYMLSDNKLLLTGKFEDSKIIDGIIYDSVITNTHVTTKLNGSIYLNNTTLNNGAKVEQGVIWNDINIQFYGKTVSGTNVVVNSYLGKRNSPWKTGEYDSLPYLITDKTTELNKTTGFRGNDIAYYSSQTKVDSFSYPNSPNYDITYEVPMLQNVQLIPDNTKKFVILYHGDMYYRGPWLMINERNQIPLFADKLSNNLTLDTAIRDRQSYNDIGTSSVFTGVPLPPGSDNAIAEVDDNFVYHSNNYAFPTKAWSPSDISINVYETPFRETRFPNSTMNNVATEMFIKLITDVGPDIDNIVTNSTTIIPPGGNKIAFKQSGVYTSAGTVTVVPVCFIEIEDVIIYTKDLAGTVTSVDIVNTNYCPPHNGFNAGKEYSWTNVVNVATYPTEFEIKDIASNNVYFTIDPTVKKTIEISFWVTWFYEQTPPSNQFEPNPLIMGNYTGGERTKHVFNFNFESSTETFFIVESGTDAIVDDNNEELIWI